MYEIENAEFECERNKAVDAFFKARQQIERTLDKEFLVESGFRLAWELLKQNQIGTLLGSVAFKYGLIDENGNPTKLLTGDPGE